MGHEIWSEIRSKTGVIASKSEEQEFTMCQYFGSVSIFSRTMKQWASQHVGISRRNHIKISECIYNSLTLWCSLQNIQKIKRLCTIFKSSVCTRSPKTSNSLSKSTFEYIMENNWWKESYYSSMVMESPLFTSYSSLAS